MARMTLGQAAAKAREAQAAAKRLATVVDQSPSDYPQRQAEQARRRLALGYRHELTALQDALADLVAGLSGSGIMRDGQLGGQRQGGHDTAAEALRLVAPKAGTQRDMVLTAVRYAAGNGATDVNLQEWTNLPANSVRPRRVELVDAGWLMDSGERLQHNGRDHVVWTLTDSARQQIAADARRTGEPSQ